MRSGRQPTVGAEREGGHVRRSLTLPSEREPEEAFGTCGCPRSYSESGCGITTAVSADRRAAVRRPGEANEPPRRNLCSFLLTFI